MPFACTRIPIHGLIWKEGSQFVNVNWMRLLSPTLWIPIQLNELAFTMLHIQRSIRMSIHYWIEWNVRVSIPFWIGHIFAINLVYDSKLPDNRLWDWLHIAFYSEAVHRRHHFFFFRSNRITFWQKSAWLWFGQIR